MNRGRPIRVLLTKLGLDGHDRGIKVVAAALRDAGMEVIYTGLWQDPQDIARAAADEDVDVVGVSLLSGAHRTLIPQLLEAMKTREMSHVPLLVGGVIPDADAAELLRAGVSKVFGPGTNLREIVDFVCQSVGETSWATPKWLNQEEPVSNSIHSSIGSVEATAVRWPG